MEDSPLHEKAPRVLPEQNNNFSTEVHVSIQQYGSTLRIAYNTPAVAAMDSCFVLSKYVKGAKKVYI